MGFLFAQMLLRCANAAQVFEHGSEMDPRQARIQELERLAGKLSLELEIAKKALTFLPRARGQNGYAERLMPTLKEEEVDLSDYQDYHDAYRQIGQFLEDVYIRSIDSVVLLMRI